MKKLNVKKIENIGELSIQQHSSSAGMYPSDFFAISVMLAVMKAGESSWRNKAA